MLNAFAAKIPWLFGGDADLGGSTKTVLEKEADFDGRTGAGRNLHYGVREHAMGAIANGIAYHGGLRSFTATFFVFSDYMRPAIRLAAMNHLPVTFVFTHDSIGLGEDGPTHQPVEHLASLRAMPNLLVVRPGDATETVAAWKLALEETKRPVVAQLMGAGTSGAYYVAMAADEVRAYPTTVTGSIGVIIAGINVSGLMERFGVADQTITTGPFKDAGSPLRPMRPEERAQLESVARDLFGSFLDVVEAGRPKLARARIEALADGRVYSGPQALESGLVDALGDLPEAVEAAKKASGIAGEARVVVYHRPGQEPEGLFWASAAAPPAAPSLDPSELAGPSFLYLWSPGLTLPDALAQ